MSTTSYICRRCLQRASTTTLSSIRHPTTSRLRNLIPASSSTPILDFLAPRHTTRSLHTTPRVFAVSPHTISSFPKTDPPLPPSASTKSSTPTPSEATGPTVAISGPGVGNASITITPRAATRLALISKNDANPLSALRVTVESGGCHGFQYLMAIETLPDPNNSAVAELKQAAAEEDEDEELNDTVFEGPLGAKVVIDEPSLELLSGSTVDYTVELIGSQFKVTGIPGASSGCGCGTSFDIN